MTGWSAAWTHLSFVGELSGQRAWCPRCGREVAVIGSGNGTQKPSYVCVHCNNGLDVFIGLLPDGEWVHLSPEEIYRLTSPLTEEAISRLAYDKCRSR